MHWLTAALLLMAATAKSHAWAITPTEEGGTSLASLGEPLMITGELWMASLLAFRVWPIAMRWVCIVLFTLFALYNIVSATQGAASCGCFGVLHVPPWLTAGVDIAIAALWFVARPHSCPQNNLRRGTWATAISAVVLAVLLIGMPFIRPAAVTDAQAIPSEPDTLMLEPAAWVGKRLPILGHIVLPPDVDLTHGDWTLILHKPGCDRCESLIEDMALEYASSDRPGDRVLLVALSPEPDEAIAALAELGGFTESHLSDQHTWFAETPVVLDLRDGTVTAVR